MNRPTTANSPYSHRLWRVRLFEGPLLETISGEEKKHFRSQKVGALLAYLALRLGRRCPREELFFAIWPEVEDTQIVANRLRVALASLRRQMEPPGTPFGTVLDVSNTGYILLREETVWCDVVAFESALKLGKKEEAALLIRGVFLPGFYEDWAILERERLETLSEKLTEVIASEREQREPVNLPYRHEETSTIFYPLPLYLTRYFGREAEKQRLLELLCNNRLVTLTGSGGMGKTRLAVEAAHEMKSPSVFVALADVVDGEHVTEAILRTLGVLPSVDADLTEQLIAIFRRREPVVLILDNVEHLVMAVAEIVLRLLEAAPELTILVTGRRALNIVGETVFALTPLLTPLPETPYDHLAESPSVALFLDRARNARPDFVLSTRYADAMRQICLLLEGVPLALELAAARVVMQTPAQIAEAMESGLLRLKSQQHGFSVRHRSLRASIQGSYDLLPPKLQTFFAELSIFEGGWTLEAARFVTDCPKTEEFLEDLIRRSLLVIEEDKQAGKMRCTFLESIRQFAAELLTSEEQEALTSRHAEYFLTLASGVTEDDIYSLLPLDSERKNLLAALDTGGGNPNEIFHTGLIGSLYYGYIRGHNRLFLLWAERAAVILPTISDIEERVRLGIALYLIFGYVGRAELVEKIGSEMQADAEANGFAKGIVSAKLILSYAAVQKEDYFTVLALSREALAKSREIPDRTILYRTLRLTSWLWMETALHETETESETVRERLLLSELLARECLAILPASSSQLAFTHSTLSQILAHTQNETESYKSLKSAQRTAISQGMDVMLIFCHRTECLTAIAHEHFDYAALLFGAYLEIHERTGYHMAPNAQAESAYHLLLSRLGQERYDLLTKIGRQIPPQKLAEFSLDNLPVFDLDGTLFPSALP